MHKPAGYSVDDPVLSKSLQLLQQHHFALVQKLNSDAKNGIDGTKEDTDRRI